MAVEKYLVRGEDVLAKVGDFYATNKRVIRYQKKVAMEEFDDLAYSHISSISYIGGSRRALTTLGIVLAALGIIGIIVNLFTDVGLVTPLSIVAVVLGVILMVYGAFSGTAYVQFRGAGISDAAGARLRMTSIRAEDAHKFISLVREHMRD